jgi:hypothetical protein
MKAKDIKSEIKDTSHTCHNCGKFYKTNEDSVTLLKEGRKIDVTYFCSMNCLKELLNEKEQD